jgi:hypothetical protein
MGQNLQCHLNIAASMIIEGLKQIYPKPNDMDHDTASKEWIDRSWAANRTGPEFIAHGNLAASLPIARHLYRKSPCPRS